MRTSKANKIIRAERAMQFDRICNHWTVNLQLTITIRPNDARIIQAPCLSSIVLPTLTSINITGSNYPGIKPSYAWIDCDITINVDYHLSLIHI